MSLIQTGGWGSEDFELGHELLCVSDVSPGTSFPPFP